VRLMLRAGVGRVQLMPLPRSDVCGVVCVRHDVCCVLTTRRHVCCVLGPEMSGGPSLRCQYGTSTCIYLYRQRYIHVIHICTHQYLYIIISKIYRSIYIDISG